MSTFHEYLEAANVMSRMTPEDRKQAERYRELIADLRTQGDDQGITSPSQNDVNDYMDAYGLKSASIKDKLMKGLSQIRANLQA